MRLEHNTGQRNRGGSFQYAMQLYVTLPVPLVVLQAVAHLKYNTPTAPAPLSSREDRTPDSCRNLLNAVEAAAEF